MSDTWVFIEPGGAIRCERCGYVYQINMPIPPGMLNALVRSFIDGHRECKPDQLAAWRKP